MNINDSLRYDLKKIDVTETASQRFMSLIDKANRHELNAKEVLVLVEAIGRIRNNWLSVPLNFISKISKYTRVKYLQSQISNFLNFTKTNGKDLIKTLDKTISLCNGMLTVLNIKLIPDHLKDEPGISNRYKAKRNFANNNMNFSKIPQVLKQKHLPVIKEAINELRQNYEKLDYAKDSEEENHILGLIKQQHQNLEIISDIVFELKNDSISELTFLDERVKNALCKYIFGEVALTPDLKKELQGILEGLLKNIQEKPSLTAQELTARCQRSPISKEAITMQSELYERSRKAASVLADRSTSEFTHLGDSVNLVYKIKDSTTISRALSADGQVLAFFKESSSGEKTSEIMEELMWQISIIFGLESQFTSTKQASIRTKEPLNAYAESAVRYNSKGELVRKYNLSKEKQGSIQVAQNGKTLKGLDASERYQIPRAEIIKGMLTILIFGMSDAHTDNIIVDEGGHIHFFDNTRSLPHSDMIWRNGKITPSFRSGLFITDMSYTNLTSDERENIRQQIQLLESKLKNLDKYFSKHTKTLKQLPAGWLNPEEALKELEKRILSMKLAIDNPNITNLQDFVFATLPDTKFFATLLMTMMHKSYPDKDILELEKTAMVSIGFLDLEKLLKELTDSGIDPQIVYEMCQNPNLNLHDIYKKVLNISVVTSSEEINQIVDSSKSLLNQFLLRAKADFKDVKREDISENAYQLILQKFIATGFSHFNSVETYEELKTLHEKMPANFFIIRTVSHDKPKILKIDFKDDDQAIHTFEIDYLLKPGYVKIIGHPTLQEYYSPEQLLE